MRSRCKIWKPLVSTMLLMVSGPLAQGVTLSITSDGKFFTLDGVPTYLNGISYFANNSISTASFRTQDLDDMAGRHINWVRAFAFWVAVRNGENIACMNPNGTVREPYMTRLKTLLTEANNRGIIVEVTMNRDSNSSIVPANQSQHIACAQTLANQLLPYRNCYFDVSNERDVGDSRFVSLPDIGAIIDAVHAIDPGRKCTASSVPSSQTDMNNHRAQGHMEFIAPHLCRDPSCPAATVGTTNQFVSWMNANGFRIPIHYNEPFRRTYNAFNPVQNDFWEDNTGAKVAEAAGWCLHNGSTNGGAPYRSFSMLDADGRLFAQLDGIELDTALNSFDRLGSLSANVRKYQDEYTEQMSHVIGRREGFIWSAATNLDAANFMVYGPYINTVPAGTHRVDWQLLVDNNSANNDQIVSLDVFSSGQTLASRVVNRMDFTAPNTFQTFSLTFTSTGQQNLEFRVYWNDHAYTQCDWVQLNLNTGAAVPSILTNSGFEGGFGAAGGGFNGNKGNNWTPFLYGGVNSDLTFSDETGAGNIDGGAHSQKIQAGAAKEGGVYNQFSVTSGNTYTVTVRVKSGSPAAWCFLGINTSGGTDSHESSGTIYPQNNNRSTSWQTLSWTGQATGSLITVFLDTYDGVGYWDTSQPGANFRNSSFETGFSVAGGGFNGSAGTTWTPYLYGGVNSDLTFSDETGAANINSGAHSQKIQAGAGKEGGVYSQINTVSGQTYTISVRVKSGSPAAWCFFGINTSGGTDAHESSGTFYPADNGRSTSWQTFTWTGQATGSKITVFLDTYDGVGYWDTVTP